ncbi:MAG: NAD(P) transhydrogenase subunit alpha [Planctomycetes bacterium]|nr:NAD(P) transhydrogenase subunit alpha [Planctomycetota bacterium]
MIVGVVNETFPGERRVALVPAVVGMIEKCGAEVIVQRGAGDSAGFPDSEFTEKGAKIVADRAEVFSTADIVCMIRTFGANTENGADDLAMYRDGQTIIGMSEPLTALEPVQKIAATGVRCFAMELVPRTTRAQAMDVLSSQAMLAGYKAVVHGMSTLPKMFPMMMTAAGTIAPARVFVIGAGVAGLAAVAAARRAGAIVHAFDVRPEVKEQIESLGAKFVEIEIADARGEGGYARELTPEERQKQQMLMGDTVAESDVVITTAAVPGKKAPVLIPADVVRRMHPGSVIVDMAAERGGNCELTKVDEVVDVDGVTILGPSNMAATVPLHASQLYGKNVANLLKLILKDGALEIDPEDGDVMGTMLTEGGEIVHAFAREVFGLEPLAAPAAAAAVPEGSDA